MPNDVMGNESLARCLLRIVRERDSPIQKDGRPEELGIGLKVLGLEVFELAQEGHGEMAFLASRLCILHMLVGRWLYYPKERALAYWRSFNKLNDFLFHITKMV
jgi:hypothetical protein